MDLSVPLHVDAVPAVDHDLVNLCVSKQVLQRPQPQGLVGDLLDDAFPVGGGGDLGGQFLEDILYDADGFGPDFLGALFLEVLVLKVEPVHEPCVYLPFQFDGRWLPGLPGWEALAWGGGRFRFGPFGGQELLGFALAGIVGELDGGCAHADGHAFAQ